MKLIVPDALLGISYWIVASPLFPTVALCGVPSPTVMFTVPSTIALLLGSVTRIVTGTVAPLFPDTLTAVRVVGVLTVNVAVPSAGS